MIASLCRQYIVPVSYAIFSPESSIPADSIPTANQYTTVVYQYTTAVYQYTTRTVYQYTTAYQYTTV